MNQARTSCPHCGKPITVNADAHTLRKVKVVCQACKRLVKIKLNLTPVTTSYVINQPPVMMAPYQYPPQRMVYAQQPQYPPYPPQPQPYPHQYPPYTPQRFPPPSSYPQQTQYPPQTPQPHYPQQPPYQPPQYAKAPAQAQTRLSYNPPPYPEQQSVNPYQAPPNNKASSQPPDDPFLPKYSQYDPKPPNQPQFNLMDAPLDELNHEPLQPQPFQYSVAPSAPPLN